MKYMDKYTLQEQAYKRGFERGFAEGAKKSKSEWVYADNSEIICKACGTRQAKFYGTGEAVPHYEQNYCHYCGCLMTYNLKG